MGKVKKTKKTTQVVDAIEAEFFKLKQIECPVKHRFTPGLYIRETLLPAGTTLTSKIHNTEHPYVVTEGSIKVWTEETGTVLINAPHHGITKPGTRRILTALTDTVWTTYHPTTKTNVDDIEADIMEKHDNPFIEPVKPCEHLTT